MRTGRGATVGVITKLVDMESTFGIRVVARNVPRNVSRARFGLLLESHGALDIGVTTDNSNCFVSKVPKISQWLSLQVKFAGKVPRHNSR